MYQVKVTPSFKSQMDAYKKRKRKRYEEQLATKQIERTIQNNSEFNHRNIVCESIIPENVHSSKGRQSKRRMRKDKALQKQQQQQQSATTENKELTEKVANHEEQTNTNKRKNEKGRNAEQRSTVVIGDSLVKNVQGWRLKRSCNANETIAINSVPGASVEDMRSYCQPTINKKPKGIILRCGTSNLRTNETEVQISQAIINLAKSIRSHEINVCVSGLIARGDDLESKRMKTNLSLSYVFRRKDYIL